MIFMLCIFQKLVLWILVTFVAFGKMVGKLPFGQEVNEKFVSGCYQED